MAHNHLYKLYASPCFYRIYTAKRISDFKAKSPGCLNWGAEIVTPFPKHICLCYIDFKFEGIWKGIQISLRCYSCLESSTNQKAQDYNRSQCSLVSSPYCYISLIAWSFVLFPWRHMEEPMTVLWPDKQAHLYIICLFEDTFHHSSFSFFFNVFLI